ncbi:TPA: DNA polymerase I [Streptococcus equi subsp. zooepidemicus]|uniref:DNA polymerase I n=1 Tax=Streptococcus equi TaxID=1336 RepID=UPI001E630815|nr:DNA polymerase I [Streptococcus equi]MCD3460205.1 DNA polymerase I [Streptococcus equi subsp. zooepidemicus]HEL0593421.1 DNA polymerase I [Streptococcus equi subsp. zooepidemicus]HEL0685696.1 DNA polymerase I [Streptococcus equi subsp. zooepidemicus]HEL0769965.1 DNA polymerase I [Streptococcus equi subsp. zooepidemicus]HEL1059689.1 DNA polymerase I [Streptococcus equi subsp. zooepidemicus]
MENKNKLLLIDGSSVAFRAFFALYNQIDRFKNHSGLHTNAIYGFHLMLDHMMKRVQPTHVLVAFDAGKTTFRTELFADYKAGRAKTPDEFREQFPYIRDMLGALGIAFYELEHYEADDIIGTLDKMAERTELPFDVTIVSGDKDLIQLTDANTVVEISKKGVAEFEEFTPAYLMDKMGLTPEQFIDLKALMGDKSDNIPGVTKIGEKTGLKLLHEYGSLEGIYQHVDSFKPSKMKENLLHDKEQAFLSKTLATINTSAPITIGLEDIVYQGPDLDRLSQFYDEMDFVQLKNALASQLPQEPVAEIAYQEVTDIRADMFSDDTVFYFEALRDNYHREELIGFAWGNQGQIYASADISLLTTELFKKVLEQPIATYDFKRSKVLLSHLGLDLLAASYDARLANYLLSTVEDNEMATLARLYTTIPLDTDEVVYGKGVKRAVPDKAVLLGHLARKVQVLLDSRPVMLDKLAEHEQADLYTDIELPLANVLAKMEIEGIAVNQDSLQEMAEQNKVVIEELTQEIYEMAGEVFNINSPKQLGVILFEKMQLPLHLTKKTKTGYSTAVDVLERLAPIAPIVAKILDYRQITKLQSTYVIGLQDYIMADGRIHTRYLQDLTQTGRLSSVDPNLQNIPIRLEQGRLIRKAFTPSHDDAVLLSSDYSQIELRVLAHISGDEHLIAAFKEGADIHTSTAMRVFGIEKPEDVTANDRRNAKAVNFGIVYGISDFGLSNNLGIPRKQAKAYIDTYFERYPGIKAYMERVVREAKDKGYVETLFKRRRQLPDINSRQFNVRSFAERTAINSPIQGSAADILKIAMINLDQALVAGGFETKMLLQVHDEIVLEVPNHELAAVKELVKETMESAVNLAVPLRVDESAGKSWYEAK